MDKILSLARNEGEQAELFTVKETKTPVQFENNRLKSVKTHQQESTALRLISPQGRLGFSTTTALEHPEALWEKAREASRFGREFQTSLPGENPPELANMYDQEALDLPMERMMEMGEELVKRVQEENSQVLAHAAVVKMCHQVNIKNTRGLDTSYQRTVFSVGGAAMLLVGKSFLHVRQQKALPHLITDLEDLKAELVEDLRHGAREVEVEPGSYPVLFAPEAMGDLMRPLLVSLNGQSVEKQVSPFRDRRGEKLFDRRLQLTDMPHRPFSPGMCPVDDEGVPTAETPLIEEGVIKHFPVDLLTAHSLGVEPSGHGLRSQPKSLPSPEVHTCVMSPGEGQVEDMLKSMKRGIFIKDLMGAWAGNPYSGEVNGNISLGFLVEDGEIQGRIKDCMLSLNSFEALSQQLLDFSRERKWVGRYLFPYALLDGVSITS